MKVVEGVKEYNPTFEQQTFSSPPMWQNLLVRYVRRSVYSGEEIGRLPVISAERKLFHIELVMKLKVKWSFFSIFLVSLNQRWIQDIHLQEHRKLQVKMRKYFMIFFFTSSRTLFDQGGGWWREVLTTNCLFVSITNHAPKSGAKLAILLVITAKIFTDLRKFGPLSHEVLALLPGNTFFYQC